MRFWLLIGRKGLRLRLNLRYCICFALAVFCLVLLCFFTYQLVMQDFSGEISGSLVSILNSRNFAYIIFFAGLACLLAAVGTFKSKPKEEENDYPINSVSKLSSDVKQPSGSSGAGFQIYQAGSKIMTAAGDVTKFGQDFVVYPNDPKIKLPEEQNGEERFFERVEEN